MSLYATPEHEELFVWGLNQHGQCGTTPLVKSPLNNDSSKVSLSKDWVLNVYVPSKVEGLPSVAEVHCGWSHTIAVTTGVYVHVINVKTSCILVPYTQNFSPGENFCQFHLWVSLAKHFSVNIFTQCRVLCLDWSTHYFLEGRLHPWQN